MKIDSIDGCLCYDTIDFMNKLIDAQYTNLNSQINSKVQSILKPDSTKGITKADTLAATMIATGSEIMP